MELHNPAGVRVWPYFAVAAVLLVLGLLVHKGRMYFLISGYNTMPRAKREKVDVAKVARLIGLWAYLNAAAAAALGLLLGMGVSVWPWVPMVFFGVTTVILLVRVQRYDGNLFDEHGALRPGAWKQLAVVAVVLVGLVIGIVALAVAMG